MKKLKNSKQSSSLSMDVSKESHYIFHCGIKVYPVSIRGKWYIQSDSNGKIKTFEKSIAQNEINDALAKTIKFYYDKLTKK